MALWVQCPATPLEDCWAQLRFAGDPGDTTALHPRSELEASPRSYVMFSANTAGSSVPKPLEFEAGGDEHEGGQPWAH